jgi:hypothetical protein
MASENGKVRTFIEGLHGLVLLALGTGYLVFEIAEKFWKETDRPTLILLNMVALLCLVLGLERFTTTSLIREKIASLHATVNDQSKKREDQLGLLERRVAEVMGMRLIKGKANVYSDAARLACTSAHVIRTMLWIPTASPPAPAPPEFAQAIAEHLKRNRNVSYEVVLAVDVSKVDGRFWRGIEDRQSIHKAQGVLDRVQVKILDTPRPAGLDMMVVDDKHAAFAFAPAPGTSDREMAVHFENQPEIAQELGRWLGKITHDAVPFKEVQFR